MRWARLLVAFGWLLVCGYAAGYIIARLPLIALFDYMIVCCALTALAFAGMSPVLVLMWSQQFASTPSGKADHPSAMRHCHCATLAVDDVSWEVFLMQHAELVAPPRTSR